MNTFHLLHIELNSTLATRNLLFQSWFVIAFLLIIAFSKDDVKNKMEKTKD